MTEEEIQHLLKHCDEASPSFWIPKLCGHLLELTKIAKDHMKLLNHLSHQSPSAKFEAERLAEIIEGRTT